MIDLEKLNVFVYAADNLSFSEAGKRLHLTQPTVSHHIKALEETLGIELFLRIGHGLQLTEAGRLLLPWAHKLIRQAIEVQEMMDSVQEKIIGHLRIACSTTAGKYILPQLAARFCQRYPGVRISILTCGSEHIVASLLETEANLAVVSSENLCDNGLECQKFFTDSITLIVPVNHPWALRQHIEPGELLDEPLIMREPTSGTRRMLLTELAQHDITLDDLNILNDRKKIPFASDEKTKKTLNIFLEVGNAEAIVSTVQAGYGVSFVSVLAAASACTLKQVVAIPVAGFQLERQIYMMRRSLDIPNRPQEVFWGFIHDPANSDLLRMTGQ